MKAILEGLQVLIQYEPEGEFHAAHDEVFAGGPPAEKMSPEDVKRLEELNWRWNTTYSCWAKFT